VAQNGHISLTSLYVYGSTMIRGGYLKNKGFSSSCVWRHVLGGLWWRLFGWRHNLMGDASPYMAPPGCLAFFCL